MTLGRFLVSLSEAADQVQNLEKDVLFLTTVHRRAQLYVHVLSDEGVILTPTQSHPVHFSAFINAKSIIVGPAQPNVEQLSTAHVVPNMCIRLEENQLAGRPIKLTFRVTASDYCYSIKYCVKLPDADVLHVK